MQIILIGSRTHSICCITWKFSWVLRQSQSLGNHLSVQPSCSAASSRWRQENKWDGCSKQLLVNFSELTLCSQGAAFVKAMEKSSFSFITVASNDTLSPSGTRGTFSRNVFETALWPKGGSLLLCRYCAPLISFPISPCNFTFSAKLCHADCYYFLLYTVSNADCAVMFFLMFQTPCAGW